MKRFSLTLTAMTGILLLLGAPYAMADTVDVMMQFTSCPASVAEGGTLTYLMKASILTQSLAGVVTVTGTLPSGVVLPTATGTNHADHSPEPLCDNVSFCSISGSQISCNLPDPCMDDDADPDDVPVTDDYMNLTVKGTAPNVPGPITFTVNAQATNSDPNLSNNTATCTTMVNAPGTSGEADLSITNIANTGSLDIGTNVTYTLTVTNGGLLSAANAVLNDTLPPQLSLVSASASAGTCNGANPLSCNFGTLANGAKATVTVVAKAVSAGTVTNTATVGSSTPDNVLANNTASATVTILQPGADLYIQQTANPNPVASGSALTFTSWITNFGPDTAVAPVMTDTLDPSFQFQSATVQANNSTKASMGSCTTGPGSGGGTAVTCNIVDMPSNSNATVNIIVTATAAGTISNTAQINSATADPNSANNSNTLQITVTGGPSGNPPPIIQSLSPSSAMSGGPGFPMTINGSQFLGGAVVLWGPTATVLPTSFVSSTQLIVQVPASAIQGVDPVNVVVQNQDGQKSGPAVFTITTSCTPQSFLGGSVSTPTVATGGTYTVTCNYGIPNSNDLQVSGATGNCVFAGFTGATTEANFNCTAGDQSGLYNISCALVQVAPDQYCGQINAINPHLTVIGTVAKVVVSPASAIMKVGDTFAFSKKVYDQFGVEMPLETVKWSSTAGSISSVGAYTSPDPQRLVTVTAMSVSNPTVTGSATLQVLNAKSAGVGDISNAYAYPVPWKAGMGKQITFDNLAANTTIRIFSVDGRQVKQLTSPNGDKTPWQLDNSNGETVASGVYYYILDNSDSGERIKGKLVIVK